MIISIYIFTVLFYGAYKKKINNKFFFILLCALWTYLFSIRGEHYGLDIKTYYKIFLDPNYYILDEPGLYFINRILSVLSMNEVWFSFSYATILLICIGSMYKLMSEKLWVISFILFSTTFIFFQAHLNIYRQALSLTIGITALLLAHRKNHWFAIIFIISLLIHKAAIFLFPLYIIMFFEVKRVYVLSTLAIAILPFDVLISNFILDNVIGHVGFLDRSLTEYKRVSSKGLISASGFDHRNLPQILCCIVMLFDERYYKGTGKYIAWMIIVPLSIASFFKGNVLLYDRVILISQFAYVGFLVDYIHRRFRNPTIMIIIILFIMALFTVYIWGPRNFLGPYELVEGVF
ncbi:EpsG family protein [Grimontia hollisae]|uniref:EpsG family protein n=1 Tax=Grimontia hollisae TaxID=673 RepID=UPI000DFA2C64|nr:EpsG family protein [Grimontia hollisae]STQ74768.1 Uncharacterised protein [Grimontia hollisae]